MLGEFSITKLGQTRAFGEFAMVRSPINNQSQFSLSASCFPAVMDAQSRRRKKLLLLKKKTLLLKRKQLYARSSRSVWVHDINLQRKEKGVYHNLIQELRLDNDRHAQYFRMTKENFDHILGVQTC